VGWHERTRASAPETHGVLKDPTARKGKGAAHGSCQEVDGQEVVGPQAGTQEDRRQEVGGTEAGRAEEDGSPQAGTQEVSREEDGSPQAGTEEDRGTQAREAALTDRAAAI